jgi:hypothetical protein
VATKIAPAGITLSTAKVNFADDALANEIAGAITDGADELVAGNTFEIHVAFEDLQIRGADAGEMNLDDCALIFIIWGATASRSYNLRFSILDPRPRRQ